MGRLSDEEFDRLMSFVNAAIQVCEEPEKTYSFVCPNCGGEAHAYMVKSNGHHHGYCDGCGVSFAE